MKRYLAICIAVLYLTATSGIVVNIHYCMGEVARVAIGDTGSHVCNTCGMENTGCCHDDLQVVKLTDDHQASLPFAGFVKFLATLPEHHSVVKPLVFARQEDRSIQPTGPPRPFSRNIMYSVFRI